MTVPQGFGLSFPLGGLVSVCGGERILRKRPQARRAVLVSARLIGVGPTGSPMGLIACQWLKALGATVIGTVGSDEKAAVAKAHGCEHVIISTREDVAERVKELTGGRAGGPSGATVLEPGDPTPTRVSRALLVLFLEGS